MNAQNTDSLETPLHIASKIGDLKAVKLLIKHGADRGIKDHNEDTAMDIVLERDGQQYEDIARYLQPDKQKLIEAKENLSWRVEVDDVLSTQKDNAMSNKDWIAPMNTARLVGNVNDIFAEIQTENADKYQNLGKLEEWLERKQVMTIFYCRYMDCCDIYGLFANMIN